MHDRHARTVPELNALLGQRERARDEGLGGHDGGHGGQPHEGVQERRRRHQVERVLEGRGHAQDQSPLAEVAEQEGREHDGEPGQADRAPAEMAQVGVERLGAGHGEHDSAEHEEGRHAVLGEEPDAVPRVERQQDRRRPDDLDRAEGPDRREPDEHDGAEDAPHPPRPVALAEEQEKEEHEREGQDVVLELGRRHLEPLGRAQHRDRRRDDAVAVEEGGAEQAEPDQRAAALLLAQERDEGEDATFAVVVQPHDHEDVLDAHDQDQRPDDEREDPVHGGGIPRQAVIMTEARP